VPPDGPGLLCVVNFPAAETGLFAWHYIEGLYARVASEGCALGWRTFVAYPRIEVPPRTLEDCPATPVTLAVPPAGASDGVRLWRFLRSERIRSVYLADQPFRSWTYVLMRMAGVRRIVVHDHTSGARKPLSRLRRLAERAVRLVPAIKADHVLAVSDYVFRRQVEIGLVPEARVTRVWNGIRIPPQGPLDKAGLRAALHLPLDRPIIVCSCRASLEKGVHHLLRAFSELLQAPASEERPLLVYVGDGPQLPGLRELADALDITADVRFVGYSREVARFLEAADIVAVPSVWQDALPLGVLEALALGRPVVATRVGGIPEMCRDGEEGLLVEPGAEGAMSRALATLLADPAKRAAMGARGRQRVATLFTPEAQLATIIEHLRLRAGAGWS